MSYVGRMDDMGFTAVAESAIGYLDERWGRPVAWAMALTVIVLAIAIVALVMFR